MCRKLTSAALLLGLQLSAASLAQDIENADLEYYSIYGETAAELRAELNDNGPTDAKGKRYDADTKWNVTWEWSGYGDEDCDLESASTSYELTVKFPQWEDEYDASERLRGKWQTYVEALALHEQGHVDIFLELYPEILEAIQAADCLDADAAANEVLRRIQEISDEYDDETRHGATQGARFP